MSNILSKSCDYGLRASIYIALQKDSNFISIKEISEKLEISFHFLTKILQKLTNKNLMKSYRGPNGGVALSKPADTISLEEIIVAIDGNNLFEKCLLGLKSCEEKKACPIHEKWKEIRDDVQDLFKKTTLAELAEQISHKGYRINDTLTKEPIKMDGNY
jgi:Rrf2 family protein